MSDEERERGIREAEEAVMIYGNIAKTGNETLDIILTEKSLLCERHKIRFTYMIDGEQLDFMDPVDIASLFGNALDNAIESVLRTDDAERRIIRLNASVKRSFFSVHFENYCGETVVFRDGMPQTVKQDNRYHAFADQISGFEEVVYLSRSDWNGTFPETYGGFGIKSGTDPEKAMKNDFYTLETNEDTSDIVFGDTESDLTFNDMKGASFDDDGWDALIAKIPVSEILDFMANAFHNIRAIPSIGFNGYAADDGPGGSDSHTLGEGAYRGQPYEDAEEYTGYGTRVAPAPTNLAYAWNKELAYENGEIILGETTLVLNLPIVIGPAMNIHRHAYNGRGCEYYSEDPILSGYTGSAVVQGAQSKGCLVNIKHAAFNDQEANRSDVAVFMNEQKARELELRNLEQAFTAKGKPAAWVDDPAYDDTYTEGALGVMTSYNRIGATASSANAAVQVDILRNEWGFLGYSVTDFTGVTPKAAPKESILAGTTAFCGMGSPGVSYWSESALKGDEDMLLALKDSMHYALYALSRSYAMDLNINTHVESLMTWWRATYISMITVTSVLAVASAACYVVFVLRAKKEEV